jgi:Na+/H+ antiporter NhaA
MLCVTGPTDLKSENAVVQFLYMTYLIQILWLVKTKPPLICTNRGVTCVFSMPIKITGMNEAVINSLYHDLSPANG